MDRHEILEAIRRTAEQNGGTPLGQKRLVRLGIGPHVWGRYWPRLSDLHREAGFVPNKSQTARPDDEMLAALAGLCRELGRYPTQRDRVVKRNADRSFPSDQAYRRRGPKERLLLQLISYARSHPGHDDVLALCSVAALPVERSPKGTAPTFGSVYLLKGPGSRYKVGRTNAFGRRQRELSIQLPFETRKLHVIECDDPPGVEAYWHQRFAAKRINSEWFELDANDVAAFKRWKRLR